MKYFLMFTLLIGAGCASTHENSQLTLMELDQSNDTIEKYSKGQKVYDGFQAMLDFGATIQNSAVRAAQTDKSARIYQWNAEQYAAEKSKSEAEAQRQTEIFLSFFVPDRKQDDLAKTSTKWKIFLDVNGKRYEGKASKIKTILADVQSQYPYHTRWNTPYKIIFQVPTTEVNDKPASLTITGPSSSAKVDFEP